MVAKNKNNSGSSEETLTSEDIGTLSADELRAASSMNDEWGAAPDDWEEESTGFPPYWNPGEGKSFNAQILLIDNRDPEFVRFVCMNKGKFPLLCANGPAEDAEPVEVPVGGQFTISDYHGLPLALLLGQQVLIRAEKKRKTSKPGQSVWLWKMKLESSVRAMLHARKNELALRAAQRAAELEAGTPAPGVPAGKVVEHAAS